MCREEVSGSVSNVRVHSDGRRAVKAKVARQCDDFAAVKDSSEAICVSKNVLSEHDRC